ncbi:MAG TPA: DUF1552 domain-containing protein [Polyangiaceae bacterium]|jgi:hypothetical protein|nr:DUF1552 domain-containing protein [Polyangiaceae bacterium]
MSANWQSSGRRLGRRPLLKLLGAGAALSPFIPLLNASGQEATFPKRLVILYTPHGTVYPNWKPQGTETNFTLSPILMPLQAHQSKLAILDGLQITHSAVQAPSHTEGFGLAWTGSNLSVGTAFNYQGNNFDWTDGPSVDQVVAKRIGAMSTFQSVELAADPNGGNQPNNRMIYSGPKQPVTPESDPNRAFSRLFANVTAGGSTGPSAAELRASAEQRSVLDLLTGELNTVRGKVAKADQAKLDAHLAGIRTLEQRLDTMHTQPAMCAPPTLGPSQTLPDTWDAHSDLIAATLACDLTRVMSLQIRYGDNDNSPYTWLGINQGHHDISHLGDSDTTAQANLTKIYTWYAQRLAHLLDKLASYPEGNGTVLDNTLVVWGSELGKGNNHSFSNVPYVLAGGAGGALQTGRYLQAPGAVHNRLLVSICQLMGLSDVQTFGSTDHGSGGLPGLVS